MMELGTLTTAEHFIMRNARLLDRHRYAYHFLGGPAEPIRQVLDAYRNPDGGYGNALDPDLRGHRSQPVAVEAALRILDELGPIPRPIALDACRYLTGVTLDDGGVPPVTRSVRVSDAAPWWRERTDFGARLAPTAAIAGLLHKHHVCHPWRDRATAFCWKRIGSLHWTDPVEAFAVCTFLAHAADRERAAAELARLRPMIRAVTQLTPDTEGRAHTPLDIVTSPDGTAGALFSSAEIDRDLDALQARQESDGGWGHPGESWCATADSDWRGLVTVQRLVTLRAFGCLTEGTAIYPRTA
ncbi:hypothetical protein CLV63_13426 [Murinocardiopsis flavida]|uniref:Prenyltransferase/squalene oxidase-like repeat protein n=2 Tax=Murinocardiopsis flavida TaxID=645275 RepID=A0A2P8CNJ8_9ACTN|nr:hypothetical protein CLV63_13426 [Murinocardiopsis flavida]